MQTRIIDGNAIARETRAHLRERVLALKTAGVQPGLAVIVAGDHPASQVYVRNKLRACGETGVRSHRIELGADVRESELLDRIAALNRDAGVHGILVQLPLPAQISPHRVQQAVSPEKDVDGLNPVNIGLLAAGHPRFVPCTPAGVLQLLAHEGIALIGRQAVVVGRSNIVGKPVALLLLQQGATVTICHSKTPDLAEVTRRADVLVVAAGKANLVDGSAVKPGAVVVDVGINRLPDGKLAGDVDFKSVNGVASHLTPVPGGVGPMTIAMLLANTVQAAEQQLKETR
ncbi:MAG: bifunctional methylenetetrahydrofolate dehydrogenase/methenyltetrahydrofolate cyclohydrolase FolD [Betaproteobacteria bacterium]|nr:bifunctional methylenetetrahydrofolate dehydrogenase/methenyltetrahydrofolate cyclohydrolase FolD [Betaproteobacteria bacterium]